MADKFLAEAYALGGEAFAIGYDLEINPYDYENDADLFAMWELGFEDAVDES